MDWRDINGWFDFQELYQQQVDMAKSGAHFVEVGAWLGKSTAFMASAIKESAKEIRFDVVDTWRGGEDTPDQKSTHREFLIQHGGNVKQVFLDNMRECGLLDLMNPMEMPSVEAAKLYPDDSLDFVFIDADHQSRCVYADLESWWPKVKIGGFLAGHDYNEPGPYDAVCRFAQANSLAVNQACRERCFVIPKTAPRDCRIFLGLPCCGTYDCAMVMPAIAEPTANKHRIHIKPRSSSALANSFNALWTEALNDKRYTHFAMLHNDAVPQTYWMDVLMDELVRSGADIIGVVSPIKDARGVTSVGIGNPDYLWSPKKRFTVRECCNLPRTFTAADAGFPGEMLLLNTACWLADIRNPKWREVNEKGELKIFFTIQDVVMERNGLFYPAMHSEDWFFSRRLYESGLKAVATTAVQMSHRGEFLYPNWTQWGLWGTDKETAQFWDSSGKPSSGITINERWEAMELSPCQRPESEVTAVAVG